MPQYNSCLCVHNASIIGRIRQFLDGESRVAMSLTNVEIFVLALVRAFGLATPYDIQRRAVFPTGVASRILRRLENFGLVTRGPRDRRSKGRYTMTSLGDSRLMEVWSRQLNDVVSVTYEAAVRNFELHRIMVGLYDPWYLRAVADERIKMAGRTESEIELQRSREKDAGLAEYLRLRKFSDAGKLRAEAMLLRQIADRYDPEGKEQV